MIATKECSMASGNMMQGIKLFKTCFTFGDQANKDITPICSSRETMNRVLSTISANW
jgi:hypothetical protein